MNWKDNLRPMPLKFTTVEELEEKINEYFNYCDNRLKVIIDKEGNQHSVKVPRPYTISGLALFLEVDRATIVNYGHREPYFHTIARARKRCENYAEEQLFEGNDRGAKFALTNNYAWEEVQKKEITGRDGGPIETKDYSYMTDDEIDKELKKYDDKSKIRKTITTKRKTNKVSKK
jgi:hypothetical protein